MGSGSADRKKRPLESLLDQAIEASENGSVSIGTLLDHFGNRSFGPVIATLSLFAIIPPIGAIPTLPTTVGVITILMAVQIVFGRKHPWLPAFIRKRSIGRDKVEKARKRLGSVLRRIDALIRPRVGWAAGGIATWLAAFCCMLLGAMMPPLELLPFAAALPGSAILLFGLGITARDGLLMLLGFMVSGAAAWLLLSNLGRLFG
ncbi:exopolysaccharide biosynthesis protein [Stakelama tenebrarum]|uniref:Exopolysaccharide biosynthesis protein n=1 Tax=Stakelama tenebrarum TaxID=2711215 RepID=A0A6G6Y292_9SPHN|nr:exopolysaccharide biosynthesis protein [Sphingosinithalassobacter tenebrarum]QIG78927.1 exopolysaccharide biosynthesis protein [Sphingosinithalassobacter tenebrarum]